MNTDLKLKDALKAQLGFWVGRSADNVQVTVQDGIVELRGCVRCDAEKKECEKTLGRAAGVKKVMDNLVVKPIGLNGHQSAISVT